MLLFSNPGCCNTAAAVREAIRKSQTDEYRSRLCLLLGQNRPRGDRRSSKTRLPGQTDLHQIGFRREKSRSEAHE